jgi:serine/threonine-protein kinase SRPK3
VILGADYGTKVDIWAIGCMVRLKYYYFIPSHNYPEQTFELLTGHWLFNPVHGPNWRIEDDHLAKMMELTGEKFSKETLARSQKRDDYFDETGSYTAILYIDFISDKCGFSGRLLRIGELFPRTVEQAMANYRIPEADAAHAAAFIRACLHLNPEERSTAVDLLHHPWLEMAYMCC